MELKDKSICIDKPVFILNSPRSGSTLLRLILASHSKISIPHEFNLVERVINYFGEKEKFSVDESIMFINSLSTYNNYKDWNIDNNKLLNLVKQYSSLSKNELIQLIYFQYSIQQNKNITIWGDKNIHSVSYIKEIINIFPNAMFIHIVRDGRDVALSLKKTKWFFYHFPGRRRHCLNNIKGCSLTWNDALDIVEENNYLFNKNNYHEIKYEELINNPVNIINSICEYLDISFEDDMLKYYRKKTDISKRRIHIIHENIKKNILKNNSNKFVKKMSKNDISLFEFYSKKNLKKYGYGLLVKEHEIKKIIVISNNIKYKFIYVFSIFYLSIKRIIQKIYLLLTKVFIYD